MILIVNTTEDRELTREIGKCAEKNGKEEPRFLMKAAPSKDRALSAIALFQKMC